jgi:hypothetical protein
MNVSEEKEEKKASIESVVRTVGKKALAESVAKTVIESVAKTVKRRQSQKA